MLYPVAECNYDKLNSYTSSQSVLMGCSSHSLQLSLCSCRSLCSLSSTSVTPRSLPQLPVSITCCHGKNNADITLIMQFHQLERSELLFLATAQKQRVIQACTSALRGCVCVCVCVTAVAREYASKQVCMFMSDTINRKRESNKGLKRVREKYCSNPRTECCSS